MRTRCAEAGRTSAFGGELQTPGPRAFHLAANRGWGGATDGGSDGLSAGGNRLAPSATNLATASRRIRNKNRHQNEENGTFSVGFVILSQAWTLIWPAYQTTLKP